MPSLPENLSAYKILEILQRTNIVEVISEHVCLTKKGRNYVGICPFHTEKNEQQEPRAFSVNPELQIYKCFSCSAGGPVFKFVQDIADVSFIDAVYTLAQRCDVEMPERQK